MNEEDSEGEDPNFKESTKKLELKLAKKIESPFDDPLNKDCTWKLMVNVPELQVKLCVDDQHKFVSGWYRDIEATIKILNKKEENHIVESELPFLINKKQKWHFFLIFFVKRGIWKMQQGGPLPRVPEFTYGKDAQGQKFCGRQQDKA